MNDENDSTFTLTMRSTSRRRSCIQKEGEKRIYEEEEDTKMRKSRRVSFNSRIQVKTIDDSLHDPNNSTTKLTVENTKANKHLADISNQVSSDLIPPQSHKEVSKKSTTTESPGTIQSSNDSANETMQLPMRHYLDISNLNQTNLDVTVQQNISMDLVNNSNSFIDFQTIPDQTCGDMTLDMSNATRVNESSMNISELKISINQTHDRADTTMDISRMPFNDVTLAVTKIRESQSKDEDETVDVTLTSPVIELQENSKTVEITNEQSSEFNLSATQLKSNLTSTAADNTELKEHTRRQAEKSLLNIVDATYIADAGLQEITLPTQSDCSRANEYFNHSVGASNISINTSKLLQSMQHTSINDLEASTAALDLSEGGYSNEAVSHFLKSNFEECKDLLIEKIEEMKRFKGDIEKNDKKNKLREKEVQNENILDKDQLKSMRTEYAEIREKISQLVIELGVEESKKSSNNEKDLGDLISKNESNEKSLKNANQNLSDIKEKVQANSERIKSLQCTQVDQEKFMSLCEKIFNSDVIEYTLLNLEKDTILLSFFYDFIQLEIKATNIVNDLSSFQQHSFELARLNNLLQKCGKYPIQKLTTRGLIDSVGNSIDSPFYTSDQDRNLLRRKNSRRVPVYIKYCVNLVLEDIGEGDLMSHNKRYKYVKDIPMLIAHFNLASRCATNLAKDFEYFANKCYDSEIKCDFDFKNHTVSITLPSIEDSCYYKLQLSILPGKYYQEAIPFSIEPVDSDDVFAPNIKRLSKVIEGQYFEDGSLRHFLRKLKLI